MKIFGIGLNKTGTKTLGFCLKHFGYRHISCDFQSLKLYSEGKLEPIFKKIEHYDSFEDWPWPLMYKILDEKYPDSKFILTTRENPETWFHSLCKHADRTGPTQHRKIVYGHEMPHDFKEEHINFYNAHNEAVLKYFEKKPGKLLGVCWESGDGWQKVCAFLGKEVPDIPFPHLNKSGEMTQKSDGQKEDKNKF
jgi:hypothetical protein